NHLRPGALCAAGLKSEKERVAAEKDRHPKAFDFKETRPGSVRAGSALHDGPRSHSKSVTRT
ncbi:MAG TPA: hypothetical protein VFX81_04285, partial [Burkholderiaceae bacterium]|nr:hypothetical protein [Burkholderiaceae bacterium]